MAAVYGLRFKLQDGIFFNYPVSEEDKKRLSGGKLNKISENTFTYGSPALYRSLLL